MPIKAHKNILGLQVAIDNVEIVKVFQTKKYLRFGSEQVVGHRENKRPVIGIVKTKVKTRRHILRPNTYNLSNLL